MKRHSRRTLWLHLLWLAASILAIYLPVLNESPLRVVLTLPVILFLPGYCLIAALFCKEDDIDLIERIALSFGLSIAVVPLIGLGLNFTPWGIRLDPIVISLTSIYPGNDPGCPLPESASSPRKNGSGSPFLRLQVLSGIRCFPQEGSRVDRILTVVITLAILIAVMTTVYVIAVPKEGERFTEFFILGENKKAADYPDLIIVGQNYPLYHWCGKPRVPECHVYDRDLGGAHGI